MSEEKRHVESLLLATTSIHAAMVGVLVTVIAIIIAAGAFLVAADAGPSAAVGLLGLVTALLVLALLVAVLIECRLSKLGLSSKELRKRLDRVSSKCDEAQPGTREA